MGTILDEQNSNTGKERLSRVFTYIRELTKLRTPPVCKLQSYDWSLRFSNLPKYPTIQTFSVPDDPEQEFDGIVLRIKRPPETMCPQPPSSLDGWIENGWEKIDGQANFINAKNITDPKTGHASTHKFEDDPLRVTSFERWQAQRQDWVDAERPARAAALVFADLFKLQGQIQRESEKFQLFVADGHLIWDSAIEHVDHPILLKKVEIEFDSVTPEFIIREIDDDVELYTSLLRHHELDGSGITSVKKKVLEINPHPLGNGKSSEFFKFFIQRFFSDGHFSENKTGIVKNKANIYRDPVIFLGNRVQGFAEALDNFIDKLPTLEHVPESLMRMMGVEDKPLVGDGNGESGESSPDLEKQAIDYLLTKPSNSEQERVISRLEKNGSVLVQGPPGTGKSHTIANVIGHLLASGKTVLVSSHTSKALRVVREKVVPGLRPLCVSVLENDAESKAQLEESIKGITSYLSRADHDSLTKEINQIGLRRNQIKEEIKSLEKEILDIRANEYLDIVVGGEAIRPSEAARKIAELNLEHGWIIEPVEPSAPLPLSDKELNELYQTNGLISTDDEECLAEVLPELDGILTPHQVSELKKHLDGVDNEVAEKHSNLWTHENQSVEGLEKVLQDINKGRDVLSSNMWIKKVVADARLGSSEHLDPWLKLIELIESASVKIAKRKEHILNHGPKLGTPITPELIKATNEIIFHLRSGKAIGFFDLTFNSSWKVLINSCFVDDGRPTKVEHFEAISALIETLQIRRELTNRWHRQVVLVSGPSLDEKEPEIHAKSFVEALKIGSTWSKTIWSNVESGLKSQGFNLAVVTEKISLTAASQPNVEQLETMAQTTLIPALNSRKLWLNRKYLESKRQATMQILITNASKSACAKSFILGLQKALSDLNVDAYEAAYNRYLDLKGKNSFFNVRTTHLAKLEKYAPTWAAMIKTRSGVHADNIIPGNAELAWNLCQWRQELDRRLGKDYSTVQRKLLNLKYELNDVNAQYVEKLSWRYQKKRTGLKEQLALHGWEQLQSKLTKSGTGKLDAQRKREAQKILKDCKNAVPVWIMPLSRVFDSFDLVHAKFDVLILDEASQSDITALVAFAIAKQVIVVGDDQQVTPYAVGQELGKIQSLINELLQGVPNRMLYDGKTSIYDLAQQSFGETIRLVEHFRCVPDIIQFSNQLSYSGEIKPLREASSSPFADHVICHKVSSATAVNKINIVEATEVASIIAAMTELDQYKESSIGVISMVGTEQAQVIDSILQRKLGASTYQQHKILCGNASQFQGDERSIMLLSMVDSCDDPPLNIKQTEDVKKTFNVAASRAQDQLWVVHSLNPATDLKPGDLRLRLIKHAENPRELSLAIEATQKKADPKSGIFEQSVIKDLMNEGYRVVPQWEVGAYRIDLVVMGSGGKKIAIECDGDRYHPPEKLVDDIQRQSVLERLGWKFIRVRGSEYFKSRDKAMKRIFKELEAFGIEKLGPEAAPVRGEADDTRRKLLSRAFEIRKEWEFQPEDLITSKKSRK